MCECAIRIFIHRFNRKFLYIIYINICLCGPSVINDNVAFLWLSSFQRKMTEIFILITFSNKVQKYPINNIDALFLYIIL